MKRQFLRLAANDQNYSKNRALMANYGVFNSRREPVIGTAAAGYAAASVRHHIKMEPVLSATWT